MNDEAPPRVAHRRRRLQQVRRLLAVGLVVAGLSAAGTGIAGLPGRAGMVSFLIVAALACAVTGVVAVTTSMIDDVQDRGVGRARPVLGVGLLFVAFLLLGMVITVAGA